MLSLAYFELLSGWGLWKEGGGIWSIFGNIEIQTDSTKRIPCDTQISHTYHILKIRLVIWSIFGSLEIQTDSTKRCRWCQVKPSDTQLSQTSYNMKIRVVIWSNFRRQEMARGAFRMIPSEAQWYLSITYNLAQVWKKSRYTTRFQQVEPSCPRLPTIWKSGWWFWADSCCLGNVIRGGDRG